MTQPPWDRPLLEEYARVFSRSAQMYEQARSFFPDGVTHDLRYLQPFPVYIAYAHGSRKWTVEGKELIDYWAGHGALLLGHGPTDVVAAVQRQVERGTHLGGCHEAELAWAAEVRALMPSAERIRFVSSGTEASLMALRLARLYTGKPKILKFAGHFHGWNDWVVPGADGEDSLPAGVVPDLAQYTVVIPPGDLERVEAALRQDPAIGAIILEPTGGHFGVCPLDGAFARGLRDLATRYGVLLIFDEVITGFRVHPGGAQALYRVQPDLTILAKIVAGGLPGGAVIGRAYILAGLEFARGKHKMKHPGTFNANPLSAAAGTATLRIVRTTDACEQANRAGAALRQRLNELFQRRKVNWICYGSYSRFCIVPDYDGPPLADADAVPYGGDWQKLLFAGRGEVAQRFRCAMLLAGVDLMGLRGMTMAAHTEADLEATVAAVDRALDRLT